MNHFPWYIRFALLFCRTQVSIDWKDWGHGRGIAFKTLRGNLYVLDEITATKESVNVGLGRYVQWKGVKSKRKGYYFI